MIYLDTSCLLKLLLDEPESEAVRVAVASGVRGGHLGFTELEAAAQLRAGWLAGEYRERAVSVHLRQLNAFRDIDPFRFRSLRARCFRRLCARTGTRRASTAGRSIAFTSLRRGSGTCAVS